MELLLTLADSDAVLNEEKGLMKLSMADMPELKLLIKQTVVKLALITDDLNDYNELERLLCFNVCKVILKEVKGQ